MRDANASLNLAMAATYAGSCFSAAIDAIAPLLICAEHCSCLSERLLEAALAATEPQATLKLVRIMADVGCRWPDPKLRQILDQIREAEARLTALGVFRSLDEYLRKYDL